MKPKIFISWLLLAFVAASVAVLVIKQVRTAEPVREVIPENTELIAYYFHTTRRCASCKKIEAYSREAIETGFGEALKTGELEWLVLNTDKPENKHFLEDYQLYTKSLVLSKIEDGEEKEWINLDKVWRLLGDKNSFIKYVQTEVQTFSGQE